MCAEHNGISDFLLPKNIVWHDKMPLRCKLISILLFASSLLHLSASYSHTCSVSLLLTFIPLLSSALHLSELFHLLPTLITDHSVICKHHRPQSLLRDHHLSKQEGPQMVPPHPHPWIHLSLILHTPPLSRCHNSVSTHTHTKCRAGTTPVQRQSTRTLVVYCSSTLMVSGSIAAASACRSAMVPSAWIARMVLDWGMCTVCWM